MMKNRIINRIGAGLLAMSCAFSMLGTTIPSISVSAAMTTENTAFPSSDEVIAQAATLLGSPYGWGFKGYTGVYYQDSYSPLSLDYVRQQGVDCSGLLYYTLTHLGYSTSGFSWNNPVPVDTPHWLSVNDNCTITYKGVTSKIDVEKANIPYTERPYWECADGSTITPGSMVIADNLNGEDHSWIYMKELQIIDEKMFERAQYILEQRAMKNSDERQIALSTKSQAMLSGVMFCAHCGGRMTSNMHTEKYTVKSTGEVKEKHYLRYICYHRSRKLCDCDGQSVYSAEKVDKAVIEVVASIFSKISDAPDEAELRKDYNKEMQKCRAKQTKLCTELKKYQKQYDKLNEEIASTLIGESFYSPEQLSAAMTTVQQRITAINQQLEKIGNEMEQKKASMEKVRPMYDMFKGWAEEFRMATIEQKKMIISQVISRIEIGKGYKINITLNMEYEQFCVGWNGLNNL